MWVGVGGTVERKKRGLAASLSATWKDSRGSLSFPVKITSEGTRGLSKVWEGELRDTTILSSFQVQAQPLGPVRSATSHALLLPLDPALPGSSRASFFPPTRTGHFLSLCLGPLLSSLEAHYKA